jgi:hypothetical protein
MAMLPGVLQEGVDSGSASGEWNVKPEIPPGYLLPQLLVRVRRVPSSPGSLNVRIGVFKIQ